MKFLALWEIQAALIKPELFPLILKMPEHARMLFEKGKLLMRYHVVGKHGGAWIYDVASNEELERLLASAPVYNFARYEIYALADMESPAEILHA